MSHHYDPELEDSKQSSCITLVHDDASPYQVWLKMIADMIERMEKISGQTFTDILNLHCDLDLESCNSFFFHRTLQLMMLY